ncbi:MAG: GFA family protein [Opitutaceae bacterium]
MGTVERRDFEIARGSLRKVQHAGRIRGFAACCGTHILFEDAPDAATVDVAIATLDDPASFPPEKAIWTEDKLPWMILDPKLPAFRKSSAQGD